MKVHLGLLDERPEENRSYRWLRKGRWTSSSFPPDVYRDIAIWLAMPGFETNFHVHNLFVTRKYLLQVRPTMPQYDDLKDEVIENMASITREDAIKLCRMRPGSRSGIPLFCQLAILDDIKRGLSQKKIAATYRVSTWTVVHLARTQRARVVVDLPPEFSLLAVQSRNPSENLGRYRYP